MLSDDRFTLAAGTGYLRGEYRALGVDADERNDRFDESLEVLRGIWTTDDFKHEGRFFTALGQTANPKTSTPVPVWIGGNSAKARPRVADSADGWNPSAPPAPGPNTPRTPTVEPVHTPESGT